MFCNTKDPIKLEKKANIIYRVVGSGCFNKHIGKTDCNLIRLDEDGSKPDQPMYQHVSNCATFSNSINFLELPDINRINTIQKLHLHDAVIGNCKI